MNSKNNIIETNELAKIVTQNFANIKSLKQEKIKLTSNLYAQIAVIEEKVNSQVYVIEEKLADFKEQYSNFAHDLAIESGNCPRSRWGGYLEPSEVEINEKGITLTWIQENPYGCDNYDYFTATLEELLKLEATQLPTGIIFLNVD